MYAQNNLVSPSIMINRRVTVRFIFDVYFLGLKNPCNWVEFSILENNCIPKLCNAPWEKLKFLFWLRVFGLDFYLDVRKYHRVLKEKRSVEGGDTLLLVSNSLGHLSIF